MRAAIYTRISKDLRDQAGVKRQQEACKKLCEAKGYSVVATFTDNDLSAFKATTKRPGFEELLDLARGGEIDVIVCWHTDRLYRRLTDLETIIEAVDEHDVAIETVESGGLDLSTATGRAMAGFMATQARFEVDHQIERQRAAHADRAARGRFRGGPVPFGFKLVPGKPGYLEHEPAEAEALRHAVDDVIAGKSLRSIGRKWAELGIVTPGSNLPWGAARVRRRIESPTIAGFQSYKGTLYEATTYEAIVSPEKWRAAVDVLSQNESTSTRGHERIHIGTGVYRCGLCGARVTTIKRTRAGEDKRAYTCPQCQKISRLISRVDQVVETALLAYLNVPENRISVSRQDSNEGAMLERISEQKNDLEARANEIAGLLAKGELTASQFRAANRELNKEREKIDRELVRIRKANPLSELVLEGEALEETWANFTPDQKVRVINALMTVTIMPTTPGAFKPEDIKIEWK